MYNVDSGSLPPVSPSPRARLWLAVHRLLAVEAVWELRSEALVGRVLRIFVDDRQT